MRLVEATREISATDSSVLSRVTICRVSSLIMDGFRWFRLDSLRPQVDSM